LKQVVTVRSRSELASKCTIAKEQELNPVQGQRGCKGRGELREGDNRNGWIGLVSWNDVVGVETSYGSEEREEVVVKVG
jgi:hypothetical protein